MLMEYEWDTMTKFFFKWETNGILVDALQQSTMAMGTDELADWQLIELNEDSPISEGT